MRLIIHTVFAAMICGWASMAAAVPIMASFKVEIDDCVVFDTGVPYVFADDCTATLTVETDTDITFATPDAGQTGAATLLITSPTYGVTGTQFFNFLEEVFFDANGNEVPICLSYCFSTDYSSSGELSFSWFANRGLPFSNGEFINGSGGFDYNDSFRSPGGPTFGVIVNGQISLATVPLPASGAMIVLGILGLLSWRRKA